MTELHVGDQVKFAGDHRWWEVRAADRRYMIAVRQEAFQPKGVLRYTIIDNTQDVRGACNLIGQGFGDGTYSVAECEFMLACLNTAREPGQVPGGLDDPFPLEVSWRNRVPVEVTTLKRAVKAGSQ